MSRVLSMYTEGSDIRVVTNHGMAEFPIVAGRDPEIVMRIMLSGVLAECDAFDLTIAIEHVVKRFLTRVQEANGDVPTVISANDHDADSLIL